MKSSSMFEREFELSIIVLQNSYGKLWGSNAFKVISMENKISGLISTCFVVTPYKQISSSVEIEQAYWTPLSFT